MGRVVTSLGPTTSPRPRWSRLRASWRSSTSESVSSAIPQPKEYVITPERRKFWAFQPVRKPPIPPVQNERWPKTPIDRFVLARLEARRLKPVKPADKRTLIRRATFDLIGLPPTSQEVDDFLNDSSPTAFASVVDRLLASPHY